MPAGRGSLTQCRTAALPARDRGLLFALGASVYVCVVCPVSGPCGVRLAVPAPRRGVPGLQELGLAEADRAWAQARQSNLFLKVFPFVRAT